MTLTMTLEEKNAILSDMVDVFQKQFDAIDEALGLPTGEDDESSLDRTMAALEEIKNHREVVLKALRLLSGIKLGMVANGIVDKALKEVAQ